MKFQMNYPAGATIIEEGSTGDCAYIIEKGIVEVSVFREERIIVLAVLSDGDIFGEMGLVSGDVRSATVRALIPTIVSVICRPYFQEKLSQTDPIIAMLMKLLLGRFHEARGKLLSLSNACLSNIKAENRGSDTHIDKEGHQDALVRFKFINDLQCALDCQQFKLVYQPIFVLASDKLAGFEALIRWNHPIKGEISPDQFIGIAEDTKDIVVIGYWVFETACIDLKRMRDALGVRSDYANPWMSINVSAIQFKEPDLPERFGQILSRIGVEPCAVKIELTESVLIENPQLALSFINEVRRLGMKVAIDDFGTGYSSLSYLHLFPIDILKIDHTFVASIFNDFRSREVVNAIVALSKNLNIDVVAEGVETKELEKVLVDLGCRYGQGYLYSRPIAFDQAMMLLKGQEWQ